MLISMLKYIKYIKQSNALRHKVHQVHPLLVYSCQNTGTDRQNFKILVLNF